MRHDRPHPPETRRTKFGIGVSVAVVLAAVAIGLLVALEAPAPTPALGQRVRVDEPARDRQSACVQHHPPDRPEAAQATDRKPPGERCDAGMPTAEPPAGAKPVRPPGDEDAGDDEDNEDDENDEDDEDDEGRDEDKETDENDGPGDGGE